MAFPKTRDEMIESGYKFENHARCRGVNCKREIEYWTTKSGKRMPFDLMPDGESKAVTHFTTCPDAEEFRSRQVRR